MKAMNSRYMSNPPQADCWMYITLVGLIALLPFGCAANMGDRYTKDRPITNVTTTTKSELLVLPSRPRRSRSQSGRFWMKRGSSAAVPVAAPNFLMRSHRGPTTC